MNPQDETDYTLPSVDGQDQPINDGRDSNSVQLPIQQNGTVAPQPTTPTNTDYSGMDADDIELIEKQWVEKAKAIVNETQGDPYKQNQEINKMKAEYIKKRYNKDIKVSE